MSTKPTKRELREQIECIAQGAMGGYAVDFIEGDDNPVGLLATMGLEEFGRYLAALERRFGGFVEPPCFHLEDIHSFETVGAAVERIWQCWKPKGGAS